MTTSACGAGGCNFPGMSHLEAITLANGRGGALFDSFSKQLFPYVFKTQMEAELFKGDCVEAKIALYTGMAGHEFNNLVNLWRATRKTLTDNLKSTNPGTCDCLPGIQPEPPNVPRETYLPSQGPFSPEFMD